MATLITGGRIIDPALGIDAEGDVLIIAGIVAAIGEVSKEAITAAEAEGLERIDAKGLCVAPGFVDMHCHLREPGNEAAETIASGARAAAKGGYTTLAALPDTDPAIDTESAVEYVHLQGERAGGAEVFAIAAMTKKREGHSLAEIGQLAKAGALAFSDCQPIEDADVLMKGLKYAAMFEKLIIDVPRDPHLGDGAMNAGLGATLAGLSGSPAVAEELAVVRGALLAREARGRYHAAHISTVGAVKRMQEAKEDGIEVSAAVAPYNLLMTEDLVRKNYDTRYKLRPPLRRLRDTEALIFGLKIGAIDALISAHAPVGNEGKAHEFDYAPFGGSMLEATFSAACESVVHRADLGAAKLIELGSTNPARLLGLAGRKGTLAVGADGDVILFDPNLEVKIDARSFISKSHVSPYDGMTLRGAIRQTIIAGRVFGA